MTNNQQKKSILKTINDYNSWCQQFKVGSMWKKWGVKRPYYSGEFDADKFKRLIKNKSWSI